MKAGRWSFLRNIEEDLISEETETCIPGSGIVKFGDYREGNCVRFIIEIFRQEHVIFFQIQKLD